MEIRDVEKLAELARIEVSEAEKKELLKDLKAILGYVSEIESVTVAEMAGEYELHNVMREDTGAHQAGIYTDQLLAEAPETKDGFIKVQKIL